MATHYGGQALIEGVLIRGKTGVFAAVRAPDGHIVTRELLLDSRRRGRIAKVPVVRGILSLGDTISLGSQMLVFSADVAAGGSGATQSPMGKRSTLAAAAGAAALFAIVPSILSSRFSKKRADSVSARGGVRSHLIEGGVRAGILLGYLGVVGRVKGVQRVFAYHGAEHKSISALEAGADLKPETVQQFDTAHPRCGTAFLFQSMVTSSIVYGLIGNRLPFGKIATRTALVPIVAGISFEVLQFNAKHLDSQAVRLLNVPGMLLQRLTTRQPSDDQVEVALEALRGAMAMDERSKQTET